MSITSEEQKIIDLENENSFLKDNLYEEQEQNEYLKDKVEKQQKEIDFLQIKIKQNENIEKVRMCMTHNLPNNAEIVCMIREDFERNFGNDFISKDKIRELIKEKAKIDTYNFRTIEVKDIEELLKESTNE